jgi:hypothetical protein
MTKNNNKMKHSKSKNRNSRDPDILNGDGIVTPLEQAMPRMNIAGKPEQIFQFDQMAFSQAVFANSVSVPTFQSYLFTLSQVHQVGTLTSAFDQYRVTEIEYWLVPEISSSASTSTGSLFTVLDFDDSVALTSVGAALDYSTCKMGPSHFTHYRRFKPHVAVAAYAAGAFTSYKNETSPWLDCNSPAVEHYGVKIAATITNTVQNFDQYVRVHLEFRRVR